MWEFVTEKMKVILGKESFQLNLPPERYSLSGLGMCSSKGVILEAKGPV